MIRDIESRETHHAAIVAPSATSATPAPTATRTTAELRQQIGSTNHNPHLFEASVHEAGHCVAAALLGLPLVSAHVRHSGDRSGETSLSGQGRSAFDFAVYCFAGPAAERLLVGSDGGRTDREMALAAGVGSRLLEARGKADALVLKNRTAIEAVAGELRREKSISAARVAVWVGNYGSSFY